MKYFILTLAIGVFIGIDAKAQIGIAVAKDEHNSAIKWQVVGGERNASASTSKARQMLREEGYERVSGLNCREDCGHQLESGYYVVVKAVYNLPSNGRKKISYGLGASERNNEEATKRAISNLKTYDWSWRESYGYEVEKRDDF